MKYYTMEPEMPPEGLPYCSEMDDSVSWFSGGPLHAIPEPRRFHISDAAAILDWTATTPHSLLISDRFWKLLSKKQASSVTHPYFSEIHTDGRVIWTGWCVNFESHYSCMSAESQYESMETLGENLILWVDHLVLDKKSIPLGEKLFRLEEFPQAIIVREDLKSEIEGTGLKGVLFEQVGLDHTTDCV